MTSVATIAATLAARGYAVFPCNAEKRPLSRHGVLDATSSIAETHRAFRHSDATLIGVATGERSGVDLLDLDPDKGAGEWWRDRRADLPETRTHRTRRGGLHLLFRHAPGVRNSASRIHGGVDVRGDGGYAIWWPGAGWPVVADREPAEWPAWLLAPGLVFPKAAEPAPAAPAVTRGAGDDQPRRYALGALADASDAVCNAREGSRNHTLNAQTWKLARLIGRGTTLDEIRSVMEASARAAGLPAIEIAQTIDSALRARAAA